jgi:hypothetical protein
MSFSQGAKWKALISTYIGTIPLGADVCDAAEHNVSCAPPPRMPVSAAMNAKVGVAQSDSRSAAQRAAGLSPRGTTSREQGVLGVMSSVLRMRLKSRSVDRER